MSAQNFPYGTFLYAVLFIPKLMGYLIFGELALGHTSLAFALVKAPLLFFDGFCLYLLATCTRFQRRNLLVYYWLNPVLFFITYIHGQLDVVSVTMCVAALVYLARGQTIASALFMAAATLSKFHVIVAFDCCVYLESVFSETCRPSTSALDGCFYRGRCGWIFSTSRIPRICNRQFAGSHADFRR